MVWSRDAEAVSQPPTALHHLAQNRPHLARWASAGEDTSGPKRDDDRSYGLAVVLNSGSGWQMIYAHLEKISVTIGQVISPETIIGAVGTSGSVTEPHLHFDLRHNDGSVDPRTVIIGENRLKY